MGTAESPWKIIPTPAPPAPTILGIIFKLPRTPASHSTTVKTVNRGSCKLVYPPNIGERPSLYSIFRYIGNLDPSVTEEFIATLFGQIGRILKAKVIFDVSCIRSSPTGNHENG